MKSEDHNLFGPQGDGPRLSDMDCATLKQASRDVDSLVTGQSAANAYQHYMRGPHQSIAAAEALAKAFINCNLQLAVGPRQLLPFPPGHSALVRGWALVSAKRPRTRLE
jgi:hypothetical protein